MTIDASKFLAQSQSRISFAAPQETTQHVVGRQTRQKNRDATGARGLLGRRGPLGFSPQVGSSFGHSGFPVRTPQQAPLFHSDASDLREGDEEDEEEREREVADYFALQRSRKHFVEGRLEDSSEVDDVGSQALGLGGSGQRASCEHEMGGIKSSWTGDRVETKGGVSLRSEHCNDQENEASDNLGGTLRSVDLDLDEPPRDLTADNHSETNSATIRGLCRPFLDPYSPTPVAKSDETYKRIMADQPLATDPEAASELPPTIQPNAPEHIHHDKFWAHLYVIVMICFFTSFVLVWLHVSVPSSKHPLGDTIYTAIKSSYNLLAIDTMVAIITALFWLALLRSYVRSLVYAILVGVPILLFSFTLYPFISTFATSAKHTTPQDKLMRWFSSFPAMLGLIWVYTIYNSRRSFARAVELLELAIKILAQNPPLLLVGFGALVLIVIWTWLWMGIFARVFLGGHFTSNWVFVIDVGTWCLGISHVVVYIWTLSVISGVQRATTAAAVSQWYFHRLSVPAASPTAVARAALIHALSTCFGTICLSTLVVLLVRLPILILPRRFMSIVGLFSAAVVSNSVVVLTHPTTLTYAAIHSQPLSDAARAVSQLSFMNARGRFGTRKGEMSHSSPNSPHRLALLLLYATRLAASCGFGFGAWVHTAHIASISGLGSTFKGSLYAYVVGLIAGTIGWAVIGAVEGVLTGIVDAVVICWESEVRGGGEARYCREAAWLLCDEEEQCGQS